MWGLIKKDFFTLKRQFRIIGLIGLVYAVMAYTGENPSLIVSLALVIAMMMPITCMAYDENCKWGKYAHAMPLSTSKIVGERYLFPLIMMALAEILLIPATWLITTLKSMDEPLMDTIIASFGIALAGIVMLAIMLPLLFKFGVEKGRLVLFLVVALIALASIIIGNFGNREGVKPEVLNTMETTLQANVGLYMGVALLAVVALYIGSFFISLAIENKKEY